ETGVASITIIIPVRNEEDNIGNLLKDIEQQNYPKEFLEVIIIDDESSDNTVLVVKEAVVTYSLNIFSKKKSNIISHKKAALTQGIEAAKGEYIVTTDGDCRVPSDWVASINQSYQTSKSKFIVGLVTFDNEQTLFDEMQTIEFASLIGTGAASLQAGFPNMCNGANLSFEKKAFYAVGGYGGFEGIQSGDDEFLMHKMHIAFPGKVSVLKSRGSVVTTEAKESLKEFYNQRKRWGSKWSHYKLPYIKILAFYIFLFNASLLAGSVYTMFVPTFLTMLLVCFGFKLLVDYIFLRGVLSFLNKRLKIKLFLITSIFYPFYVSFFAVCSNIGGYSWKGRKSTAEAKA
ncbi:MAG TPA: glycosyltransferase, partial [Cytophagaceae bacterium]